MNLSKILNFLIENHSFSKSLAFNLFILFFFTLLYSIFPISLFIYYIYCGTVIVLFFKYKPTNKILLEKLIALFIFIWGSSFFTKFVLFQILIGFMFVILIFLYIKIHIKKWYVFTGLYLISLIISGYLTLIALAPLIENNKINNPILTISIIAFTIILIILLVSLEKNENTIKEYKVGTYCAIAIIATLTAGMFYIEDYLSLKFSDFYKEKFYEELNLNTININIDKTIATINSYSDTEEILHQIKDIENIDINLLTHLINNYIESESKNFVSKTINIILFPYLVMGVWCTFIIELKERNIFRNTPQKTVK